jgi:serine/threonine protein kinase
MDKIAEGSFGQVFSGYDEFTQSKVAIKVN